MNQISKSNQYKTRCGYRVAIDSTNGVAPYSVRGSYLKDGNWITTTWTSTGHYLASGRETAYDLVEVNLQAIA